MLKKIAAPLLLLFCFFCMAQEIIGPENPTPAETTAIRELKHYLGKVLDGPLKVAGRPITAIYVGNTKAAEKAGIPPGAMKADAWKIRCLDDQLVIAGGGTAGTLYGVYAFLENQIGIHWWTPDEESVPPKQEYNLPEGNLEWEPLFAGRDIYRMHTLIPDDGGRFLARNRMNRGGDSVIRMEYGGSSVNFGRPYHTHTFHLYFRTDPYLRTKPEYFALYKGTRRAGIIGQLCLSNPEMKRELIEKMKAFIVADEKEAAARGTPAPNIYDLTANDTTFSCQCEQCVAVNRREKSEMGTLLYFVNDVAREMRSFRPHLMLSTSAYGNTLRLPAHVRPEPNVIIRFCITSQYLGLPLTAPENRSFLDHLKKWRGVTDELYVWLYSITYSGRGFPFAGELNYGENVRALADNGVKYIFWEHEDPDIADMYALKVWLECKLSENPYADDKALTDTFLNGYYGAAGTFIAEYRTLLHDSMRKMRNPVPVMAGLHHFTHLTYLVTARSHELFDKAENAVKRDPVLLQRVREARMGLDRYTVLSVQKLTREFRKSTGKTSAVPFDSKVIIPRIRSTYGKILSRIASSRRSALREKMDNELNAAAMISPESRLPERFLGIPEENLYDFQVDKFSLQNKFLKVVKDPLADTGKAVMMPTNAKRRELPLLAGSYVLHEKARALFIQPRDIRDGSYHWYKLKRAAKGTRYIYFLSDWTLQVPCQQVKSDSEYDVWASIRFQGPLYPHGGNGPNAIFIERVILTKYIPVTLD